MSNKRIILGSVNLTEVSQNFEWYAIVTGYNMEEQYVRNVMDSVKDTKFEKLIAEYYIPIQYKLANPKEVKLHQEKPKIKKLKGCFSNYVFIRCKMNEDLWNLLRSTTGASIIITAGGIPVPTSNKKMKAMKKLLAPVDFPLDQGAELLLEQRKKYVKILPGVNDDTPGQNINFEIEKLKIWLEQANEYQKTVEQKI